MLNRVLLMGRLTRAPELRYTQTNVPVCTITLAVERDFAKQGEKREADFVDVVCWRGCAEFVSRYFGKGQLVACDGRLQSRKWQDQHGQNRVSFEVVADNVYFAEQRRAGAGDQPATSTQGWDEIMRTYRAENAAGPLPVSDFAGMADDEDDVPF